MCIFTYGLSSSRSTFFFAIFLLFPRGRDFRFSSLLAFFPLDGFGSSTQQKGFVVARQQNRIGRLSPFLLSRSLLDEQKSASSESRRKVVEFVATSRSIIMVDEQRTTDNDRENAEGDDDGATAPVPEKVTTLLLKHRHRFFAFDDKTTKQSE